VLPRHANKYNSKSKKLRPKSTTLSDAITLICINQHKQTIMTVESFLTRELTLRFIDARNIATEAKLNLEILHYPTKDQEQAIREEACRIFASRPKEQRQAMQRMSADLLEAVRIPNASLSTSLRHNSDIGSVDCSEEAGPSCDFSKSESSSVPTRHRSIVMRVLGGTRR
jgi:hypothetical protein